MPAGDSSNDHWVGTVGMTEIDTFPPFEKLHESFKQRRRTLGLAQKNGKLAMDDHTYLHIKSFALPFSARPLVNGTEISNVRFLI